MKLNTAHFGIIEVDEKDIIEFPEGLPGFESEKRFILLGKIEEDTYFDWLQSIENEKLAFVVINPRLFLPDYTVEVDDVDVKILGIEDENKVLIYTIVVIPENMSEMSANLKAPVLINTANNKGKQVVMERSGYEIRHYIIDELKKIGG